MPRCRTKRRAGWPAIIQRIPVGFWCADGNSKLVESRTYNLRRLNLRSSIQDFRQDPQHRWIDFPLIVFRVLFPIPQTESERFISACAD
jgi:hypothetical protein